MRSLVMMKSAIKMAIDTTTTVRVVLRPTPSVPPLVRRPKWQPTMAMMKPKTGVFAMPLKKSAIVMTSRELRRKKRGEMSN